jgi:hypothetical protein
MTLNPDVALLGPSTIEGWPVPRNVTSSGGDLVYEWFPDETGPFDEPLRDAPTHLDPLDGFLALRSATPEAFAAYARVWGPLGLERWRRWLLEAQAMIDFAYTIQQGNEPSDSVIAALRRANWKAPWPTRDDLMTAKRPIGGSRVAPHVNRWLNLADIKFEFRWGDTRKDTDPAWVLRSPNLFGGLAFALAQRIAHPEALYACSACGAAHRPGRRPAVRRGKQENTYCRSCQLTGARERFATRAYRERERVKKQAEAG